MVDLNLAMMCYTSLLWFDPNLSFPYPPPLLKKKMFCSAGNIVSVPFLIGLSYMDGSQASCVFVSIVVSMNFHAHNTCPNGINQIKIIVR